MIASKRWSWLASLALGALALGACGESVPDARPPSPSGALADTAPHVWVIEVPQLPATVLDEPARVADPEHGLGFWVAKGVVCDAAYARSDHIESNRIDARSMGQAGAKPTLMPGDQTADWVAAFEAHDYRVESGPWDPAEGQSLALPEGHDGPQARIVRWEDGDWGLDPDRDWARLEALLQAAQALWSSPGERARLLVLYALQGEPGAPAMSEEALRVPLLFAATSGIDAGERRPTVVTLADVGPTLLDLCGVWPEGQQRGDLQGASFARVLIKEPIAWRGFGLALASDGSAWVRSARWRLIRYADGRELLSQVDTDPRNMGDDRAVPGAVAQFRGLGLRMDPWLASR